MQLFGRWANVLNKYYIKYEKIGKSRYISHLDFLRTIGRAMRRAGLPLKYSEGFNPHPLVSFASPLSVGITSSCELFSIELTTKISVDELLNGLNASLVPIIKIAEVSLEPIDFKSITWADYEITPENSITDEQIKMFLLNDEIIMDKKTKKGIKETNIREYINRISQDGDKILMTLSTGDNANLKPMLAIEAINKYCNTDLGFCYYHRAAFRNTTGDVI